MNLDNILVRPERRLVEEYAEWAAGEALTTEQAGDLLDELANDEWRVDVTLPMLELARRRVRGLVRFLPKVERRTVYTDFEDELGTSTVVDLPGTTPGTDWERFRAKARAYLREHEDHVAL